MYQKFYRNNNKQLTFWVNLYIMCGVRMYSVLMLLTAYHSK